MTLDELLPLEPLSPDLLPLEPLSLACRCDRNESERNHFEHVGRLMPDVVATPYNEQFGFPKHVEYISGLHDKGKIVLSGPFMEKPGGLAGELADGGLAISRPLTSMKRPS